MNFVVLAAGKGSRFAKEGVATPKPLIEVAGKPMLLRLCQMLSDCGADNIYVVANREMSPLIDYLE